MRLTSIKALFLTLFLSINLISFGQESEPDELGFAMDRVQLPFATSFQKLKQATSIHDLNRVYSSSWIEEFLSVDVITVHNGKVKSTTGLSDIFSDEQKVNMLESDVGHHIKISIQYMPKNNLAKNEKKEYSFSFLVDPDSEASYPGGETVLNQYIKATVIDKIKKITLDENHISTVKFTVNEDGKILNPHLFWPSEYEEVDAILLESICNMSDWIPAEYANGLKISQEFALSVGNLKSCVINMLNIAQN